MRPVADPAALLPGATLYHSAFGFARVDEVAGDAVRLSWERSGAHLPSQVRFDNLKRVYAQCAPEGFFHKALASPEGLRRALLDRPADALVWLLDDLGSPQRVRDVMDWLVGRELFTPKTFVRWWGTAEGLLRADGRLTVEGEWIQLREREAPVLVQLDPGLAATEPEGDLGESISGSEATFTDDEPTRTDAHISPQPVSLADANPPGGSLAEVGYALARALAEAHGEGRLASPHASTATLLPDGTIRLGAPTRLQSRSPEGPSPEADVRAGAVALIEAFTGRAIPPTCDPSDLLPYLRHRIVDAPPSGLAPIMAALRSDPERRPTAAAWMAQWEAVRAQETRRAAALDPHAILHAGYDSHVGRVKLLLTQTNQDALWVGQREDRGLYVLADGISISDAGRGEQASWIAATALARVWSAMSHEAIDPKRLLSRALHLANRSICEAALRAAGGNLAGRMPMGTTLTLALTHGNRVHLAWLGDSRAWILGPTGASLLTADDNVSGERFLAWCDRRLRAWSADGHALVRYLGHFDEQQRPAPFPAHHIAFTLLPGERLLLCSDGITDYVGNHEADIGLPLQELGMLPDPHDACRALVALANQRGGGDNATAILIEVAGREGRT